MNFEDACRFVMSDTIEGGLVNDPSDPGGITNHGISLRWYKTEVNPYATDSDIINISTGQARELYRLHFWKKIRGDELRDGLDVILFDAAVNQGVGTAVRLLQKDLGVKVDGLLGPITLAAANDSTGTGLLVDFFSRRAVRYAKTANFDRFGRGWFRRLGTVLLAAVDDQKSN